MNTALRKVLFVDRDGTLVAEPDDCQLDRPEKIRLVDGVIPALLELRDAGYAFVIVTNQDGLGTDNFPSEDFERCHSQVLDLFASQGIRFEEVFVCPHLPSDSCDCRKPRTGLVSRYLAANALDLEACAVVGDRESDLEFARRIGVRGFRIDAAAGVTHGWSAVSAKLRSHSRSAIVTRNTRETEIVVAVMLDTPSPVSIATGIGFLDHMLEQVARHGGFSMTVTCQGDLDVDEHHTVEDTAICLGEALRRALGEKRGISRFGFLLPMDESEAQVALDLSGRAAFQFSGKFRRELVGGLPTELVPHFFSSLADSLGAALHITVTGENDHHQIEACFKGVGRTLRQAIRIEDDQLPTTKGRLG